MAPRRPLADDIPESGRGSAPDLGRSLEPCGMGDDCPYAGSMRWLHDERLKREQVEGELAATVDRLADEVQKANLQVQSLKGSVAELEGSIRNKVKELDLELTARVLQLDATFKAHVRSHRWIELVIMGLAMSAATLISRYLGK